MLEYTLHELFHLSRSLEKERGAATGAETPAAAASVNRQYTLFNLHQSTFWEYHVDEPLESGLTSRAKIEHYHQGA